MNPLFHQEFSGSWFTILDKITPSTTQRLRLRFYTRSSCAFWWYFYCQILLMHICGMTLSCVCAAIIHVMHNAAARTRWTIIKNENSHTLSEKHIGITCNIKINIFVWLCVPQITCVFTVNFFNMSRGCLNPKIFRCIQLAQTNAVYGNANFNLSCLYIGHVHQDAKSYNIMKPKVFSVFRTALRSDMIQSVISQFLVKHQKQLNLTYSTVWIN